MVNSGYVVVNSGYIVVNSGSIVVNGGKWSFIAVLMVISYSLFGNGLKYTITSNGL
jgi:hypothetical protein